MCSSDCTFEPSTNQSYLIVDRCLCIGTWECSTIQSDAFVFLQWSSSLLISFLMNVAWRVDSLRTSENETDIRIFMRGERALSLSLSLRKWACWRNLSPLVMLPNYPWLVTMCVKAIKQGELTEYTYLFLSRCIRIRRAKRLNNSTNVCEVWHMIRSFSWDLSIVRFVSTREEFSCIRRASDDIFASSALPADQIEQMTSDRSPTSSLLESMSLPIQIK